MPYWYRFMETFPTIMELANAPEEQVLRLWQGLGYYSRARNLHKTAKYIAEELNGVFPSTYSDILKLKGVGPYTAAAIASICFDEAEPVVDGNVFRFASRYFGIKEDISKTRSRNVFVEILKNEMRTNHPGSFNQAMMEYGATTCSPSPDCDHCDFSPGCFAFKTGLQKSLPIKSVKTKVRNRFINYIVLRNGQKFFLKQRDVNDVWGGLFDFYLMEGEQAEETVLNAAGKNLQLTDPVVEEISEPFLHILSHQKIHARFYLVDISDKDALSISQNTSLTSFSVEEILNLPKPKLIVNYLDRIGIK